MRNKLTDLHNMLFEQLERLMDAPVGSDEFEAEKERSKLVTDVATTIVNNAKVQLDAISLLNQYGGCGAAKVPEMLGELKDGAE